MAIQLGSAYGKVVIDSSGATRGVKESSSALKGLTTVSKTVTKALGALSAEAVIMKKAFDLGRQGGEVIQTAESFEVLLKNVGAAPDLLKDLQVASRGTVSDMKLMTSTSTLLAGTQGELASALANSTPELLEIAKAAQKLNPALGDTTFLYDSLARGIKRASPLILDNLGIVVKVSEANETYAKSIGKSADALTAEEQKMALLNETLRAGRILIEQAGGSTESATDDFDRLNASIENITNNLKARLFPVLADAASTLELLLTWNQRINEALKEQEQRLRNASTSWDDYVDGMVDAAVAARRISGEEADLLRQYLEVNSQVKELTDQYGELGTAKLIQLRVDGLITEQEFQQLSAMIDLAEKAEDLRKEIGLLTEAEYEGIRAGKELTDIQDQQLALNQEMIIATRQAAETDEEAAKKAQELADKLREINRASREAAEGAREAASDVSRFLDAVDRDLGSPLESFIKDLKFLIAGGAVYNQVFEQIKIALSQNRITPEEAKGFSEELFIAFQQGLVEAGLQTKKEAAENISDALSVPIGEANKKLDELTSGLDAATEVQRELKVEIKTEDTDNVLEFTEQGLHEVEIESTITPKDEDDVIEYAREPSYKNQILSTIEPLDDQGVMEFARTNHTTTITVRYNVQGIQSLEGVDVSGPGGQHGLNIVVPPGFPNDSFPVLASSGERVLIIPQNKRQLLESPTAGMSMLPISGPASRSDTVARAASEAGLGGDIFEVYQDNSQFVEQNFYDEGAAALGMAILQTDRMKQLDASMGV